MLTPGDECDATLSVSSDSVSLPTQVEMRPQASTIELTQKLTEASLEEAESRDEQKAEKTEPPAAAQFICQTEVAATGAPARPSAPTSKGEAAKDEGPQDLRVFELNSDSGKSTPSNNGKKGIFPFQSKHFQIKL